MFRVSHRIFRPPAGRIPNRSAQTGTPAGKRATETSYKCPRDLKPKTSLLSSTAKKMLPANHANKTNKNYSRPFALFAGKFSSLATRAAIFLNSTKGFSSFPGKMLRRAFKTQSYLAGIASSSARLNLKLSRKSRFARLRSCALPIAFLVAVMPTRWISPLAGKMKTVIKRPSIRFPSS